MVFLLHIGLVAHQQILVVLEKVIVIRTLNVLEALFVEKTTVEEIFRHRKATGTALPIAVQVYKLFNLFMYYSDKVKH